MLNYKLFGEGEKYLIILHGLFGSLDNWHTLAQRFSERFKVLLVDQRNHGKSPHYDQHNYALMASDIKELMDQLNVAQAHFLGHSMGGKTVMKIGVDFPYLIDQLVVVDIAPRYYAPHHQTILAALQSVDFSKVSSRKEVEDELARQIEHPMVLQFLLKGLTYEASRKLRWKFNLKTLTAAIDNIGEALSEHAYFTNPTLFIKGELSDYITLEDEELIDHIFPQSEIVVISEAGHWLHAEQPQIFFEEVSRFLN